MLLKVLLLSSVAGIVGTVLGGIVAILIKKPSDTLISNLFYLSSGVMIGISFVHLIPEALEYSSVFPVLIGLIVGITLIFLIESIFAVKQDAMFKAIKNESCDVKSTRRMSIMGMMLFLSISLHNLPEGLAIGVGADMQIGIATAIAIGIHNIPEGIAIGLPMKLGKSSSWRIIKYCTFTGIPTVLGGILGYLIGSINSFFFSFFLATAAGSMLFVVFAEMIPKALELKKDFKLTATLSLFSGIVIAILLLLL